MLDARAKALLAGDEKGWMAPIADGATELLAEQRRLFRLLTQMGVDSYRYRLDSTSGIPGESKLLTASVKVGYCVGAEKCRPPESDALLWLREDGGRLLITRYKPEVEPRPWEVGDLRVETGRRVVVGAIGKYANRLDAFRREADRAAVYANRFGPRDGTLGKHLIFLGVPGTAADRWYGGAIDGNDYGFSYNVESTDAERLAAVEHVLRPDKVGADRIRSTLSWHLGYGAATTGVTAPGHESWGLRVGISTYLGQLRDDPAGYVIDKDLRLVLKKWKGHLSELYPERGEAGEWQTAAWTVVYHLIDRYGEKKFIAFFNAVAREGVEYAAAAKKHLGRSLKKVEADVRSYLRGLT